MTSAQTTTALSRHGTATVSLPSEREILIVRQFGAPAALVFRAVTTPDLVKRWWGFITSEWLVCEIDLHVGGQWRYLTRETGAQGSFEVGFHGEYKELEAPHRIVSTEVFEGLPDLPGSDTGSLNTVTFVELDGVTTMTTRVLHGSQAHRDMHIESGMEGGMQVSFNRLEDLVAKLNIPGSPA
jgi:uncharacterized protein YndB with AHSA1/START domain